MIDLSIVPQTPGCYIYKNKDNQIIYIGKAKNLKKRVSSYFLKKDLDPKTMALVSNIHSVEFIITNTELEALILESNLIKKNKPKYNIELKDSREYSYILLAQEKFPYLMVLKKKPVKGEVVFGPFIISGDRNNILSFVNRTFKLRTCFKIPKTPCIRYHIGYCTAPCINLVSQEEYMHQIKNAILVLQGREKNLIIDLEKKMKEYMYQKDFEKAIVLRDQIKAINYLKEKQNVETNKSYNQDLINYILNNNTCYLLVFNISKGVLLNKKEFIVPVLEDDFLDEFIIDYYSRKDASFLPDELILPKSINKDTQEYLKKIKKNIGFVVPEKGEKKELLDLALRNIEFSFFSTKTTLEILKDKLRLNEIPRIIECFDISHLSGTNTVASMVQFKDGKPNKSQYRRFKIKTIEENKINDFASISEVVNRRYSGLLRENLPFPDLIIIDGGKGQLSSAKSAIESLNLDTMSRIISIAKKNEEIYSPELIYPLKLDKKSRALHLIQEIRDEAHRFAITYNKLLRKKEIRKK